MKKDLSRFLNNTIIDLCGRGVDGNMFGVELELEGRGVQMEAVATKGWKRAADGSLRGESIEYVFSDPCVFKTAKERVVDLFKKFKANNVDIKNSYRTSTHVHLNFGDKTVKQLLNFFTLFTMLEDILERYSGEERGGNLFCLSSRRGEAIMDILANCVLEQQSFRAFAGDAYKYAACNLSTLYKFGTAEIRTMRGADSVEQVNNWLDILNDLYERALRAKTPIEFIENISILGPDGFLADVLTARSRFELLKGLPIGFDFRGSLMEGARLCQMFAYEIGEDFLKEPPKREAADRYRLPGPLNAGQGIRVFIPRRGRYWSCVPPRAYHDVFTDGAPCADDHSIVFDEAMGRFRDLDDGGKYLWFSEHPVFGNEHRENGGANYPPIAGAIKIKKVRPLFAPIIDHDEDED